MSLDRDSWAQAIGAVLFERRTALGLTQKHLAESFWGERSHYYAYEKSQRLPSIPTLAPIAKALGMQVWELIREVERVRALQGAGQAAE